MKIRKNMKKLTNSQRKMLVDALLELKNNTRHPSVLSPNSQSLSRYDDFVETHKRAMDASPSWAHNGPAFGPWHRVFLREFERELQRINPLITIPYWDWTIDQSTSALPWTSAFMGGNGIANGDLPGRVTTGPFAGSTTWPVRIKDGLETDYLERGFARHLDDDDNPTAPNLPSAAIQSTTLQHTEYAVEPWHEWRSSGGLHRSLRTYWEAPLHNLVHRWVYGNMMTASSPNDPVFWLHHCNIDRLWAVWQNMHPNSAPYLPDQNSSVRAELGHNIDDNMIFHAGGPAPWLGSDKPGDVIDHRSRRGGSVWYDTDPPEIVSPMASLDFGDVPEGSTVRRAIIFSITSPNEVTVEVVSGPSGGFVAIDAGTPITASVGEDQEVRIWVELTAPSAPSISSGEVTIRTSAKLGDDSTWENSQRIDLRAISVTEDTEPLLMAEISEIKAKEFFAA